MTQTEINQQLIAAHQGLYSSAASSLHPYFSMPEKWSVAHHVAHINISLERLNNYLTLPKPMIEARFGTSEKATTSYEKMAEIFKVAYEKGVKATPPFEPPQVLTATLQELIDSGHQLLKTYQLSLENWSEEALDHYRCPHPFLGMISAREILYFTIYHVLHHHKTVENIKNYGVD